MPMQRIKSCQYRQELCSCRLSEMCLVSVSVQEDPDRNFQKETDSNQLLGHTLPTRAEQGDIWETRSAVYLSGLMSLWWWGRKLIHLVSDFSVGKVGGYCIFEMTYW